MTAIFGPYKGNRTWFPDPALNPAQVNAAIALMRDDQDWKPLDVIEEGKPERKFPPKNPRR